MTRSRLVVRNVLTTLVTQVVSWVLTFAVTFYLPKYLGDVKLGQLTLAGSVVSIFGVFVSLGTSYVLIKDIARDRRRTSDLLVASALMRVPMSLAMTLLAIGAAYALGYAAVVRTLIVVGALGMMIGTLNDALSSALQGQENLPRMNVAALTDKFLSSGLIIALVIVKAPLWTFVAVGLLTGTVSLVVNLTAFRPLLPTLRWPKIETVRYLVKEGTPFMGLFVFFTLFGQTDAIVIRLIANDATVGWYAAAYRIIGITMFLPSAIATATLPTLARLFRDSQDEFHLLARRILGLIMLCGVPISAVLIFLPDRLVSLMHYPQQFAHSVPALRIGGAAVLLWYATCYIARLAAACDQQKNIFRTSVIAAAIGIPACFAATYVTHRYYGNGATGALLSDVLVEMYLLVAYVRMLPAGTFNMESLSFIGRCAFASAPMIILLLLLPATFPFWIVLPCCATYAVMCWMLRCFHPQDMALLRGIFQRKVQTSA